MVSLIFKSLSGKGILGRRYAIKILHSKRWNQTMAFKPGTLNIVPHLIESNPEASPCLFIGQQKHLETLSYDRVSCKLLPKVTEKMWKEACSVLSPNEDIPVYRNIVYMCVLPANIWRHNTPSRALSVSKIVRESASHNCKNIVIVCEKNEIYASVCAVAKALPTYSMKKNSDVIKNPVIELLVVGEDTSELNNDDIKALRTACEGVRMTAHIVDTPANEMTVDKFIEEVKSVGECLQIHPTIIRGEELAEKGMGGIYGVGKASLNPPALVILSHTPKGAVDNIAWVGKGIVFDTGGLSIKGKTGMPGMKRDCGGAAAVLGAFYAAVQSGFTQNLHAIFCLAENSVGPKATRPDDIHVLYSGRSVEINNTDAEGRLVLSDGVVYAAVDLKCTTIVDIATLTGAQGIATGKYHGALLTNDEPWERLGVLSGKVSGDLVHPLVFAPELHFSEFNSSVADMKNSVNDRSNALSSCAGLFILSHLGFDFPGSWVHIDMASPSHAGERATGYGVALLETMFSHYSESEFIKKLSPSEPMSTSPPSKKMKM